MHKETGTTGQSQAPPPVTDVMRKVLKMFESGGTTSRAEIARRTALARSTVSQQVDFLLERRILDDDLATSPLKGQPLRQRLRNFRPDADAAIRALVGPPLWMRRLREIEAGVEWHEIFLEDAWRTLAKEAVEPAEFERTWEATASTWRFRRINALIDQHNRNFPAEARLPMDPKTRDFVRLNGQPYQRQLLDAGWVLARFPADLAAARAA